MLVHVYILCRYESKYAWWCVCAHVCASILARVHACVCAHVGVHIRVCASLHADVHTGVYTCVYAQVGVRTCGCKYAGMCGCVYVFMNNQGLKRFSTYSYSHSGQ